MFTTVNGIANMKIVRPMKALCAIFFQGAHCNFKYIPRTAQMDTAIHALISALRRYRWDQQELKTIFGDIRVWGQPGL